MRTREIQRTKRVVGGVVSNNMFTLYTKTGQAAVLYFNNSYIIMKIAGDIAKRAIL
jgi:hypothetical protein